MIVTILSLGSSVIGALAMLGLLYVFGWRHQKDYRWHRRYLRAIRTVNRANERKARLMAEGDRTP